jgi:hypothetical protein
MVAKWQFRIALKYTYSFNKTYNIYVNSYEIPIEPKI